MWLLKQICFVAVVVILLRFEHVSAQILVQVFLETELEHPRPHTGEDCGCTWMWMHMDVNARLCPCDPRGQDSA